MVAPFPQINAIVRATGAMILESRPYGKDGARTSEA
jgi:hypothetical protein